MQKEMSIPWYAQYKNDVFTKLNFEFRKGLKLLDVGCGDGTDAEIFINEFGLRVSGIDIYRDSNIENIPDLHFQIAGIYDIPFPDGTFDYVFSHDVLHHIDEPKQRHTKYVKGLQEMQRVCNKDGTIIIIEANRYNPLSYPHMVLLKGHNHIQRSHFIHVINQVFDEPKFRFFEAHLYPKKFLKLFKLYEQLMERSPLFNKFLAYNVAIVKNKKQ